jgi:MFS family permease
MTTLTGGVFLVALALELGASNFIIGMLAALPALIQILQIPGVYLVNRIRNRRAICVYASLTGRQSWLLISLIPILFSSESRLTILLAAILINAIAGALSNCSWNSWMRDLIPEDRLGSFFSTRMRRATAWGIVLGLAGASFLDGWKKFYLGHELIGYSVLYLSGFLAGMISVHFLASIPETRLKYVEASFFRLILKPFRDANFKALILFLGSWNFAINLAAPFFTVYMLKTLDLSLMLVLALGFLSQVLNFAFLRVWGRFADRFANKSVLGVSAPLFVLCILAWTFTTLPDKHALTIPLLVAIHALMGISTAGVTLASANIALKLAPKGEATPYLAAGNLVNSLAAGIAPMLGGKFVDFFAARQLSWTLTWTSPGRELTFHTLDFKHWDFFFALAFLIGLYSIHRLSAVREVGEVKEEVVFQELASEIRKEFRNPLSIFVRRKMAP